MEEPDDSFVGEKISPALREMMDSAAPNEKVKVILQADNANNKALEKLLADNQAKVLAKMPNFNAMEVEIPLWAVERVSENAGARHISLNGQLESFGHIETTTGITNIRSEYSFSGTYGDGIGIAVIDSGVNSNHKTFRSPWIFGDISRLAYQKSFISGDSNTYDSNGHGTHVAGLALGDTYNNDSNIRDYRGVASRAKLISLRVLDYNGVGNSADLLKALDWIYENRNNRSYNLKVVNISLGTAAVESYRNDPLCRAVRKLVDAGIVVVAAAGNNGKDANGQKDLWNDSFTRK